jgi:ferric-chelate reductase
MTVSESEKRGSWFTQTMYTGIAALVLVLLIVMSSVPYVRRHHYNLFYYSHVALAVVVFVASCVHANTNFYLLIPGLLLWIVDLFRRFFRGETGGLSRKVTATVENAGNAWIRISLPTSKKAEAHAEKSLPSTQPLSSYYLTIPSISKLQNHAFAAAIPSSSTTGPVFLLQRAKGKSQEALDKEWTWKLGNMVPRPMDNHSLEVKVEGPYPVNDAGFRTASHIVCIVGGTGITGASSLARWWLETVSFANRFTLIWTVRRREMAMVREWQELEEMARPQHNMSVNIHVSSEDGRLDALLALQRALGRDRRSNRPAGGSAWVYSSGPDSLLGATERACVEVKKNLRASRDGRGPGAWTVEDMSWYMARWEV